MLEYVVTDEGVAASGRGFLSPVRTLDYFARKNNGHVPLGTAERLIGTRGFSAHLVGRYVHPVERYQFMDAALHPVAQG
ncbi:hypothetical protein HYU18_02205 [Candidatus Woesearchaeota archaeon]|nr:hypothetical protein [Candidatus Woesearchaeota archaeon]